MAAVQGARVQVLDFLQHLRHPVGAEKRRAFAFFDLAHLLGHPRTLVEQLQKLFVQRVNLIAQRGQVGRGDGGLWLAHGCWWQKVAGALGLGFFKVLHVIDQGLHACQWHGVVNAGAHATD